MRDSSMRVRDRSDSTPREREVLPSWLLAAGSGAGAACASATMLVVLAVLGWLTGAGGSETAWATVAAGLAGWAFAHGAALTVPGGQVDLAPWLLLAWPLVCARWSAQRVVPDAAATAPRLRGFGGARRDVVVTGAAFVVGYVLAGLALAVVALLGGARPSPVGTGVGAALVALVGYAAALAGAHRGRVAELAPRITWAWREYVPAWVARAVRPAATALMLTALAGLLLLVVAVGFGIGPVTEVYGRVGGGIVGTTLLTLAQIAYVPTLMMWCASWLAGPGFTLGGGSSVTWGASSPGIIPLVPVLAATPAPGPLPAWTPVVVLVPILIGVGLGVATVRRGDGTLAGRARLTGVAVLLYALGVLLGALAASGSVGGGRYAHVGVDAVMTTLALAGEVGIPAFLVVLACGLRARRPRGEGADAEHEQVVGAD